jgi:hypothetical protein
MFCYVLPLVDSVPPLRYALAASASCHIAARNADKALERKSLFLRVQATGLLRERLRSSDLKTDPTILASILMLAQLDVRFIRPGACLTIHGLTERRCVQATASSSKRT